MSQADFGATLELSTGRESSDRDWKGVLLAVVGFLGILVGFTAWAISSPIGSTPDEDYHLGSIWCPRPVGDSGCAYQTENGDFTLVEVPEAVKFSAVCHAFKSDEDASCLDHVSDEKLAFTDRFDDGGYPFGYYQFQNLFVGDDVSHSVISMRLFNVLIGLGGIALVAALSPRSMRPTILVSSMVAWTPMGIYFISSVNPTGWSVTGVFIYAVALLAASVSEGSRRWMLMVMMVFGGSLSITSRADSAFYLLVVTLAMWILVGLRRKNVSLILLSVVTSIIGLLVVFFSGQGGNLTGSGGWPTYEGLGRSRIFLANTLSLPELIGGFWGFHAGPGWFDVPLLGWSTLGMLFIAGGVFLVGADKVTLRRGLATAVILGGLLGIPVVSLTLRFVQPVGYYQPRYVLPLLAVFFLVWLWRDDGNTEPMSGSRVWFIIFFVSVANFFALRQLMVRYMVGVDEGTSRGVFFPPAQWWPWAIPPEIVLFGSAACLSAGLVALALASGSRLRPNASAKRENYASLDM